MLKGIQVDKSLFHTKEDKAIYSSPFNSHSLPPRPATVLLLVSAAACSSPATSSNHQHHHNRHDHHHTSSVPLPCNLLFHCPAATAVAVPTNYCHHLWKPAPLATTQHPPLLLKTPPSTPCSSMDKSEKPSSDLILSLRFWSCSSYNYSLCDQNNCYYAIFISIRDTWNFRLRIEHDSCDLKFKGIKLSLFSYYCNLWYKSWPYEVEWLFWTNNSDLEVHLIEHELEFSWSCVFQMNCWAKYDHLDRIRWFMVLNILLKLVCIFVGFHLI